MAKRTSKSNTLTNISDKSATPPKCLYEKAREKRKDCKQREKKCVRIILPEDKCQQCKRRRSSTKDSVVITPKCKTVPNTTRNSADSGSVSSRVRIYDCAMPSNGRNTNEHLKNSKPGIVIYKGDEFQLILSKSNKDIGSQASFLERRRSVRTRSLFIESAPKLSQAISVESLRLRMSRSTVSCRKSSRQSGERNDCQKGQASEKRRLSQTSKKGSRDKTTKQKPRSTSPGRLHKHKSLTEHRNTSRKERKRSIEECVRKSITIKKVGSQKSQHRKKREQSIQCNIGKSPTRKHRNKVPVDLKQPNQYSIPPQHAAPCGGAVPIKIGNFEHTAQPNEEFNVKLVVHAEPTDKPKHKCCPYSCACMKETAGVCDIDAFLRGQSKKDEVKDDKKDKSEKKDDEKEKKKDEKTNEGNGKEERKKEGAEDTEKVLSQYRVRTRDEYDNVKENVIAPSSHKEEEALIFKNLRDVAPHKMGQLIVKKPPGNQGEVKTIASAREKKKISFPQSFKIPNIFKNFENKIKPKISKLRFENMKVHTKRNSSLHEINEKSSTCVATKKKSRERIRIHFNPLTKQVGQSNLYDMGNDSDKTKEEHSKNIEDVLENKIKGEVKYTNRKYDGVMNEKETPFAQENNSLSQSKGLNVGFDQIREEMKEIKSILHKQMQEDQNRPIYILGQRTQNRPKRKRYLAKRLSTLKETKRKPTRKVIEKARCSDLLRMDGNLRVLNENVSPDITSENATTKSPSNSLNERSPSFVFQHENLTKVNDENNMEVKDDNIMDVKDNNNMEGNE